MGKRSNFARHADDFYPTPRRAVLPLIPHLRLHSVRSFAEPCCGDGALVEHLESFELRCILRAATMRSPWRATARWMRLSRIRPTRALSCMR
jgi:hypothetical protein